MDKARTRGRPAYRYCGPDSDRDAHPYSHHSRYPDRPGCQSDGYGPGPSIGYCGCFYAHTHAPASDSHAYPHTDAHADAEVSHPNAHTDAKATHSDVHAHPNAYGPCSGRGIHHGLKRC